MATKLCVYAFFSDFVLYYPIYAVVFERAGLSATQLSSLFIIWSVAGLVFEVPTGAIADLLSRRLLLTLAPLVRAVGFGVWTVFPGYLGFAAGFICWSAGSSLESGTLQALAYDELNRLDARDSYAKVIGMSRAAGTAAVLAADIVAAPVLAASGLQLIGLLSAIACLPAAAIAWTLPDSRGRRDEPEAFPATLLRTLKNGFGHARHNPGVLRRLMVVAVVVAVIGSLEEYVPLLAAGTGTSLAVVPLLVLPVTAGQVAGSAMGGRGNARLREWMTAGAVLLAIGSLVTGAIGAAGLLVVAAAFGILQWSGVVADARLQDAIADETRATVTSIGELATTAVTILTYAGYATGTRFTTPAVVFSIAALPYLTLVIVGKVHAPSTKLAGSRKG